MAARAYQDFLARDRYPVVALYVDLPHELVDVNVHPAKTEVRFRNSGLIRGLIVSALRHALADAGHRASTTVSDYALGRIQTGQQPASAFQGRYGQSQYGGPPPGFTPYRNDPAMQPLIDGMGAMSGKVEEAPDRFAPHPFSPADIHSAQRGRSSMKPISSRKRRTVLSSSINTPPMSALSMKR